MVHSVLSVGEVHHGPKVRTLFEPTVDDSAAFADEMTAQFGHGSGATKPDTGRIHRRRHYAEDSEGLPVRFADMEFFGMRCGDREALKVIRGAIGCPKFSGVGGAEMRGNVFEVTRSKLANGEGCACL